MSTSCTPSYTYVDSGVVVGQRYQYQMFLAVGGVTNCLGYTEAGIQASAIQARGNIIMLVDTQLVSSLTAELLQLTKDLVGDGWQVISNNFARHDDTNWSMNTSSIASIKGYINSHTQSTKGIYIIGHLAIPYSGSSSIPMDGHTNHVGAYPADVYYGNINGTWTDNNVRVNTNYPANDNQTGDGKWDNNTLPSALDLFVGRVDFARLPSLLTSNAVTTAEINLIKQYLGKAHNYRFGLPPFPLSQRGVTFGDFDLDPDPNRNDILENHSMYTAALANCSAFFGPATGSLVVGDPYHQRTISYQWGFAAGPGGPNSINASSGLGYYSSYFTNSALVAPVAFYLLYGSYFGDWNMSDDIMRATIAGTPYGLATILRRWPSMNFEGMAMGETLGDGLVHTLNSVTGTAGNTFVAILGDPTLRLHTLSPPTNFIGHPMSGCVSFTWDNVSGVQYYLYKAPSITGQFTPINTSACDSPYPGSVYMLRAVQLVTSGSGSYGNISQGVFWP